MQLCGKTSIEENRQPPLTALSGEVTMSINCQLCECGRVGLFSHCKTPATTKRSRITHLTHRMRNNKLLFLRALQFGVLCYAVTHNQNTTLSLYNVIFCKPFVSNVFLFFSDTSLSLISWHIRANPRVLPAWDADQPPFLASLQRTYEDQDGVQEKETGSQWPRFSFL